MDILATGELLIDFTPIGESGDFSFKANPGGAPCNFLAAASKTGLSTGFIGKIGDDGFGNLLEKTIINQGIDSSGLIKDPRYNTTLAFVQLDESGERSFSFYRKQCADIMLEKSDVKEKMIEDAKLLHFGSLSLTDEPSRSTVLWMVQKAKDLGKIVSYDPNYRPLLWDDEKRAVEMMILGMKYADIVKVSEEEMELLTGTKDLEKGCSLLMELGPKLVCVTLGEKGTYFRNKLSSGIANPFKAKVVDTTGAGDTFFGTFVALVLKTGRKPELLEHEELLRAGLLANSAASLCIEGYGGIPSIPDYETTLKRLSLGHTEGNVDI